MNLYGWLQAVRNEHPLVHNMTNLVVNNITANALLSVGASPVMSYAEEEVADMARIAKAVALNMGTLTPDLVSAMVIAGKSANAAGVPVVFDPVGVGATPYRNEAAKEILSQLRITALRGNAGEMGVLLKAGGKVQGVDSAGFDAGLPRAMKDFAKEHNTVVIATGPVDYVTDGESLWKLSNGDALMAVITGSGCMLTGLLGAFLGVAPSGCSLAAYAEACVAAITAYNVAGELAATKANGPGTFGVQLFDALYRLEETDVARRARVEIEGRE